MTCILFNKITEKKKVIKRLLYRRLRFTPRFLALLLFSLSSLLLHFSLSLSLSLSCVFFSKDLPFSVTEERKKQVLKNKMLLGKRPRHPMKRTTSLSNITFDLETNGCETAASPSDPQKQLDQRFSAAATATVSPRTHRRVSADFLETAHFLRACSLCKRRLVPGRDIYMYRGDSAFCSLECRQQQMNQDERKEKWSLLATKKEAATSAAAPEVSTKGETVAAL